MTSNSSVTAGLTMLTSGVSQYLHPDYLQPLPTTLDAKKSPLALLAQTCSAIGKDSSPSKSIIPPLEKSSKDNNNDKTSSDKSGDSDSSSSSTSKRPSSHGHKDSGRESSSSSSSKPGFRTFPPKEIPPLVPIPSNGENNNGSKSSRLSSAEPKPATSPLMNSGASSLTVPPSLPRPVSANGAPRTSSRGSSSGKSEGVDHHHHHHHHNGSHHHHHQHGSNGSHHSQHSSSHHHHRHRESPASSGSSSSSSSSTTSSSSQHPRPSSSPSYSKSSSTQASSSVMHSPSSSSSASAMKQPPAHVSHSSMLAGLPAHLAGYPNPLALMGQGLDASSYHSALAAHSGLTTCYTAAAAAAAAQSSALKAAAAGGSAAALSPFVTYARVRTPSGATTLVPVCRDPYCTNCQLTVQNSHMSSNCTAPGCAQCAHEKSLTSLSALGSLPGAAAASSMLLPPLSSAGPALSAGSMSALSSLHSLYPHSALAAAAAAHQGLPPYVCSWVAGSDYCGKRFNTSEELLQHLRTHTSSLDVSSLAASYAGLGGIPSALAAYPHLSAAPLSPNSLRRAYPSSLSPVSSLLSASRYHPYKSPLSGVGAPPPQSLPPVGPYYSPYTLYGQRIGAAVVP